MRLLFLVLLALVCLIQYPLWLGKGGWFKAWDLQKQLAAQRTVNEGMRARNAALDAEVHDLQTGTGALEERARSELSMMKDGEVFVQIVPPGSTTPASVLKPEAPASKPAAGGITKPASATAARPASPASTTAAKPASASTAKPASNTTAKPASNTTAKPVHPASSTTASATDDRRRAGH